MTPRRGPSGLAEPNFDMRSLTRLATWGTLAAVAMGFAIISAYSSAGTRRLAEGGSQQSDTAVLDAARTARTQAELARLTDQVRALAADREQLLARVATLEHGLDDVTGSIKHPTTANPAPAAPPTAAAPAPTPPRLEVASAPAASVPADATAAKPADASGGTAETRDTPEASDAGPGLGVDVGGAVTFEGLRTLWLSIRRNSEVPDSAYPLVAARENGKTRGVDLRLLIGPLASTEAAAKLCASLSAAHHYCQPVAFAGQRLSLAEPASKMAAPSRASPEPGAAERSRSVAPVPPVAPVGPFRIGPR